MHTQSALSFTTIEQILKDDKTRFAIVNDVILINQKF